MSDRESRVDVESAPSDGLGEVRPELIASHDRVWASLGAPGTWIHASNAIIDDKGASCIPLMIQVIEKTFDIKINHPVIPPAAVSSHADRA